MSVVGIDFGNNTCCIAVARAGGIETIDNDYSQRQTPTCVAFGEKKRILGVAAKNQQLTNMKNTVVNFKRLLGRSFRDAHVTRVLSDMSNEAVEMDSGGGVGLAVRYMEEQRQVFTVEQITSMLFTKLKETSEAALGSKVSDVVISVPLYFTDCERRALLDAARVAGLNVLRLMNDTTASALAYGIYKSDLPDASLPPRNVVFVDCGQSSMQASVCAFNAGKLKVLATAYDTSVGGGEFDKLLTDYFVGDFKQRYGVDAATNDRVRLRLMTECEKIKKQMSANSTRLPLNIESFMDDKDVSGTMDRAKFEQMAAPLLESVEALLARCLAASQLATGAIHSVEVVGGGSRVPAVRRLIEKVFATTVSTTLNQDEAVARGCALQCAMLSPTFLVREFSIVDQLPYTVRLIWPTGDMDIFPQGHEVPYSKMLTFNQSENFSLTAKYSGDVPLPDPFIGTFSVNGVSDLAAGSAQKVKVKVRINKHGVFTLASATLVQRQGGGGGSAEDDDVGVENGTATDADMAQEGEAPPVAGADTAPATKGDSQPPQTAEQNGQESQAAAAPTASSPAADSKEKCKVKVVKTELPVQSVVPGLRTDQVTALIDQEMQMIAWDKLESDRQDAKNSVEGYVYDLRNRLSEELSAFVVDGEKEHLKSVLDSTEDWLYGDGEDCQKSLYQAKLGELKKLGEPICVRHREYTERPDVFNAIMTALNRVEKQIQSYRGGDESLAHLDPADVDKVEKSLAEKRQWMDQQMNVLSSLPSHQDAPITNSQLHAERQAFESMSHSILNKPKPKPKVEEPPAAPTNSTAAPPPPNSAGGDDSTPSAGKNTNHASPNTMDVD